MIVVNETYFINRFNLFFSLNLFKLEFYELSQNKRIMEDTIEQMRQEMTSIDKKIKIIEAEVKVIKSDPSNYINIKKHKEIIILIFY